jgi:hypothetical protein
MGDLINLKRVKKAAARAAKEKTAAANRVAHGTAKRLRKAAKAEKENARQKIEAHKLDPEERR